MGTQIGLLHETMINYRISSSSYYRLFVLFFLIPYVIYSQHYDQDYQDDNINYDYNYYEGDNGSGGNNVGADDYYQQQEPLTIKPSRTTNYVPFFLSTAACYFLGSKIQSKKACKKQSDRHYEQQKQIYTQYYNDVYKLQTQNE